MSSKEKDFEGSRTMTPPPPSDTITNTTNITSAAAHPPSPQRIAIPTTLLTPSFDMRPMAVVLDQLASKMVNLEEQMYTLTLENQALKEEVNFCTQRYEISQEQFAALNETVVKVNENLDHLNTNLITKAQVLEKVSILEKKDASLLDRILDLDNKKIDANSMVLENRIRDVSEDFCGRFLLKREREQKDWMSLQVSNMDTKLTVSVDNTKSMLLQQLEENVEALNLKLEKLNVETKNFETATTTSFSLHQSVDKFMLVKLESHEKSLDASEASLQREVDRIENNLKRVLKLFGLDWSDLLEVFYGRDPNKPPTAPPTANTNSNTDGEGASSPSSSSPMMLMAIDDDFEIIETQFQREISKTSRKGDTMAAWKSLKLISPKLYQQALKGSGGGGDGSLTSEGSAGDFDPDQLASGQRRLDLVKEDRVRRVKQRREARMLHQAQGGAGGGGGGGLASSPSKSSSTGSGGGGIGAALTMATKYLLSSSFFQDLRKTIHDASSTLISASKNEVIVDFSNQVQALQRELRNKVTVTRAVELIEEYASKKVQEENAPVIQRMSDLEAVSVTREEVQTRLAAKADLIYAETKASNEDVDEKQEEMRKEVSATAENVTARLTATFEGKLKDLSATKLDKHDSNFLKIMTAMEEGAFSHGGGHSALWTQSMRGAGAGGASGNSEKCVSCNKPVRQSSTGSTDDNNTNPNAVNAAAAPPQVDVAPQARKLTHQQRLELKETEFQELQDALHRRQMMSNSNNSASTKTVADPSPEFSLKEWAHHIDDTYNHGSNHGRSSTSSASLHQQQGRGGGGGSSSNTTSSVMASRTSGGGAASMNSEAAAGGGTGFVAEGGFVVKSLGGGGGGGGGSSQPTTPTNASNKLGGGAGVSVITTPRPTGSRPGSASTSQQDTTNMLLQQAAPVTSFPSAAVPRPGSAKAPPTTSTTTSGTAPAGGQQGKKGSGRPQSAHIPQPPRAK